MLSPGMEISWIPTPTAMPWNTTPLDWTTCCSGKFWNDEALNPCGPNGCLQKLEHFIFAVDSVASKNKKSESLNFPFLTLNWTCHDMPRFRKSSPFIEAEWHWQVLMLEGINRSLVAFQRIKAQDEVYYAAYRRWADTFGLDAPSNLVSVEIRRAPAGWFCERFWSYAECLFLHVLGIKRWGRLLQDFRHRDTSVTQFPTGLLCSRQHVLVYVYILYA